MASMSSKEPVGVVPAVATTAMTCRPSARRASRVSVSAGTSMRKSRDGTTTAWSVPMPSSPTARATP